MSLMKCRWPWVERFLPFDATMKDTMNVLFFDNTLNNHQHQQQQRRTTLKRDPDSLFVFIVTLSTISLQGMMKILENVNNGGSVLKISNDVKLVNVSHKVGLAMANGIVQMHRMNTASWN
jgi:type IV secretory pathway VirB6-like protein